MIKLNKEALEAALLWASQEVVEDLLKDVDDLKDERDEAHAQIAALRKVLERIEPYLGHESGPKDPKGGRFPTWGQIIRAALTDTAKAAEGYQLVKLDEVVVQRGDLMMAVNDLEEHYADICAPEAHQKWMKRLSDAAAPNSEAGEGTG